MIDLKLFYFTGFSDRLISMVFCSIGFSMTSKVSNLFIYDRNSFQSFQCFVICLVIQAVFKSLSPKYKSVDKSKNCFYCPLKLSPSLKLNVLSYLSVLSVYEIIITNNVT